MPDNEELSDEVVNAAEVVAKPSKLGDRLRNIAQQLRSEDQIQIQATSRILSAAAKLAENQDRLIDEVVDMVETDLANASTGQHCNVEDLKASFKTLAKAKAHFQLKANTWAGLADKINQQNLWRSSPSPAIAPSSSPPESDLMVRMERFEQELRQMREEMGQMLQILQEIRDRLAPSEPPDNL